MGHDDDPGRDPDRSRETLARRVACGPPLLLDGALGTELEARGQPAQLPLWSSHALLDAPEIVTEIHRDYLQAGAEILTADTFRTQRRVLERAGRVLVGPSEDGMPEDGSLDEAARIGVDSLARALTRRAVALARHAAERHAGACWIAGSAPPLEDCYRPDRVPGDEALRDEHRAHARNLAHAGVDLILVETINSAREGAAAAGAARATGLPFFVSFVCWERGRLLSGEPLRDAIEAVRGEGPLLVGVNCLPVSAVGDCLPALVDAGIPFGVYENLGAPETSGPGRSADCSPEEFARHASAWIDAGASLVGGCCGTTPAHIAAIARVLRG